MSTELLTLGLLALVVVIVLSLLPRGSKRYHTPSRFRDANDLRDPGNQMRYVLNAKFSPRKVMNLSEYKVFKTVEDEARRHGLGYRVFSQTSLGEILQSSDKRAFAAINSKRVDVLVISPTGMPTVAVEYQGAGHHQGNAAARDAVKKEALRRAGIGYVEVDTSHTPAEISALVRRHLAPDPRAADVPSNGAFGKRAQSVL